MAEERRITASSTALREAQRQLSEAQAADQRAEQHAQETVGATDPSDNADLDEEARIAEVNAADAPPGRN
jgi:hypothetical protein